MKQVVDRLYTVLLRLDDPCDEGKQAGLTTDERERIKALEREVRELRQASETDGNDDA